ncbi:cytochrome c oxidase subunit II [filamentous cyanobacterium LEGE 11480]|uniref:Cytochrome c oxidase subunit 2 n=1 Tax=Romeriopsis navalis LEGE 11480 TaxID=2777977 RepID=A0A928Z2T6_9CYAN|nr:cytochrome c oxidase subunit II [Romeriopsis navalis]MBE9029884.1 cytochrome c oxidase subunit II [Romeriopsis navalis LEGE 11480]
MQQIPSSLLTLLAGIIITLISFWVGQNNHWLPEQASLQAPLVDQLFNVMVGIGTALFIIVQGLIIYGMVKFRQPPGDETDGSDNEGNIPLEILWTAIPAVIVIGLGVYSVDVYQQMGGFTAGSAGMEAAHAHHHQMGDGEVQMAAMGDEMMSPGAAIAAPAPKDLVATTYGLGTGKDGADLVVNVTGMQFAWLFEYPDQGVTVGELHVPAGKKVKLQMKAVDVLHAFWIPQFRLKQDVMPGLDSELQFTATKTGTFPVFCAELCGAYHGSMRTTAIVESPEVFNEWLKNNQIAQADQKRQQIAQAPSAERSDSDFLQPYAQDIGVDPASLEALQQAS